MVPAFFRIASFLTVVTPCATQAAPPVQLDRCSEDLPRGKDNVLLQLSKLGSPSTSTTKARHSWVVQVGAGSEAGKSRGGINGNDHSLQRYFCPMGDLDACQPDPKHGIVLGPDALRPCRSGVVSDPMAKVEAGSKLFVSWMGNGHVNNGQSDGTCVRLMLSDFEDDPAFSGFTELPGGACASYWHYGADGTPTTSTWIEIPASTAAGKHTMLWYWNFTDFWYSSCADIEVMPAGSIETTLPSDMSAPPSALPPGLSRDQIDTYILSGCNVDEVASPQSNADAFCVAYVGPGSYCKHWATDECGRSSCHQGDFLLPCGEIPSSTSGPEPEPEPEPSATPTIATCGDDLCNSMRAGSWCRANGVCHWTNVPCACG